jgi:ribulose-bisphosphate carboxylase large chain
LTQADITPLLLGGERFEAVYHIRATDAATAETRARGICVEQTVEFPPELISSTAIRDGIIGEIASLKQLDDDRFEVIIGYPVEAAGTELTQLINVLFGNVSIQPGIQLADFRLPASLLRQYRGPRFGINGLRELTGAQQRPLLCTALKPMGLSASALAERAYQLALGGIDLIKDDHGLADQAFCPFDERVARCAEAVQRANHASGLHARYLPNVTAPFNQILRRAERARDAGAGGLLFCPGLAGFDAMRTLADDDALALPVLSHPAFQGSFAVAADSGLSHRVLYGRLNRLAGADAAIFPHFGGRFAYSEAECRDIVSGCTAPMTESEWRASDAADDRPSQGSSSSRNGISTDNAPSLAAILPVPAGGMRLERIDELVRFYGRDCMLLIGGDLHARPSDLVGSCQRFRHLVESAANGL